MLSVCLHVVFLVVKLKPGGASSATPGPHCPSSAGPGPCGFPEGPAAPPLPLWDPARSGLECGLLRLWQPPALPSWPAFFPPLSIQFKGGINYSHNVVRLSPPRVSKKSFYHPKQKPYPLSSHSPFLTLPPAPGNLYSTLLCL